MSIAKHLPSEGTIKAVSYAVIALAGIYYISRFSDFHKAGSEMLKPVTDSLSNLISKVRFAGDQIQATNAGVILRPKDFRNGVIDAGWYHAQKTLHPDNLKILDMAIGQGGALREPYSSALKMYDIILILPDGTIEVSK